MNNYHNKEVLLYEAWELAIIVNDWISQNPFSKVWEFSQMAELILSEPEYELYNRDDAEFYLERNRESFIGRNQRIEPSGSGI